MTLGQRIQELRKQRGLSQEELGDALGVSRQAVSKWEGDNGIPELDTLIAMSRLFAVTVGQLLGVEEAAEQKERTPEEAEAEIAESILRRYVEQSAKKTLSQRSRRVWLLSAAVILLSAFIVLFAQLGSLRNTVRLLRSDLSNLQVNVSNSQQNLSGQIRNTIYDVLSEEASLFSTFQWELLSFDLEAQTATLQLDTTMKEYVAGSQLQFCADWQTVEGSEGQSTSPWATGPNFSSTLTLPMNHETVIRIRVEDTAGNIKEQVIETPIYDLHPDNFHLTAYNLTLPFPISFNSSGALTSTITAEWASIQIMSQFPTLFWPEKAVMTAYINEKEVVKETLEISPSDHEDIIFNAMPKEEYYTKLEEGDVLRVDLVVTDNLGRTRTFSESVGIKDGALDHAPTAPAISVSP